jgi:FMN reductase
MRPVRIVVVSAGLGQPSTTRMLADRLAGAVVSRVERDRPAEVRVIELRELATDIANNFVTGFAGSRLRAAQHDVAVADALIAVTPIFTASYSGLFKSFFDVLDPETLIGTPVLIAATGGTPRHSLALEHALRPLFAYLRAVVTPTAVYAANEDWGSGAASAEAAAPMDDAQDAGGDTRGDLAEGDLAARIDRAAGELAALLIGRRAEGPAESAGEEAAAGEERLIPFEEQLAALAVQPDRSGR